MPNIGPAVWKIISELKPEDLRVRLIGRVIDLKDDIMIIDDGTGTILVNNSAVNQKPLKSIVLVIGSVHQRTDGKLVVDAEIIKDFDNINFEIYLKTYDIIKNYR